MTGNGQCPKEIINGIVSQSGQWNLGAGNNLESRPAGEENRVEMENVQPSFLNLPTGN